MIEFHGWVSVRESTVGFVPPNPNGSETHERFLDRIDELDDDSCLVDARWVNAMFQVTLGGRHNHRGGAERYLEFFRWIATWAPGSYGLLYYRDDEAEHPARREEFRVLVMARGEVSERIDPFLSPCVPVIEDEISLDDL
ncbi:hypothetical protein J4H86_23955 [Spiractinospora alimapuensis]|uniref:Imm7 family immunity protein n=1 Tax=Spiractinospora alimapuensis TaxID=2820884 RepID=UPI001F2EA6E9|nr:Imm7 family immunity protein [Spiractinospora alimapuensis]QVQ51784.1 hypothetical protein J4H86_23955 [Spiractinospora alimapuensis]